MLVVGAVIVIPAGAVLSKIIMLCAVSVLVFPTRSVMVISNEMVHSVSFDFII